VERAALGKSLHALQELLKDELRRAKRRQDGSRKACRFLEREIERADSIEQHLEREDLECAVVGITKAGKSTIVNALIGDEVLPVSNIPATAVSIKVRHSEFSSEPRLLEPTPVVGTLAVQQTLHAICSETRDTSQVNGRPVVEARFSCFKGSTPSTGSPNPSLVDTPGVTEASGSRLTEATLNAVESADVVLLVLNYGNLKTEAERQFLSDFARRRPDFFLRGTGRLLCILTRMDLRNRNGVSVGEVAEYLRDHVSASLQKSLPEFAARIFPLKAELALLGRLAARGHFDRQDQAADYMRYLYGRQGRKNAPTGAQLRQLGATSVELSGLEAIEVVLQNAATHANDVRSDSVRSRLINALNRSCRWSSYSTGKAFAPEVVSLRDDVLHGPKPPQKKRVS